MSTLDSEVLGIAPAGLPMRAIRSKGGRGIWSGWHHCPWKVIPPPASPGATPRDAVRKLRPWPEVTPKDLEDPSPPVVRVAPLHDGGITMRRTSCRDLYSLGEVTVSCMLTSFAPVLSNGLSQ